MATLGAVQLDIVINGKSITITKDHAISLKVTRLIGDSADQFTLEAFDETAYQLESALMGGQLASISVRYSVSTKDNKQSILFSGTCYNYELTFAGRATMLSITGILASSTGIENGYWFDTRAVEWVGGIDKDSSGEIIAVDGKSQAQYANYEENEDVCAILDYPVSINENGEEVPSTYPVIYYNPARIFKRIIHAYNGDKLGSTTTTTTTNSTMNLNASTVQLFNIKKNDTTDKIWNYLTNTLGYNQWVAAGIMGNMMQESSMNPSSSNSISGGHYGLCQWSKTYYPSMWGASLDTQLAYIDTWLRNEYNTFKFNYREISPVIDLNGFLKLKDAQKAARAFCKVMERPGEFEANLTQRARYALGYLNVYTMAKVVTTTTTAESSTTVEGWGTGGNNGFILGEVQKSRWIADMPVLQNANETAAQYITNTLCKYAVTDTGVPYNEEIAGYQYIIKNGKHCFIPLNYGEEVTKANTIEISYGMQGSEVISFTISKVGVLAMMGNNATKDQIADATSTDYLYGDAIREGGENILGVEANSESLEDNSEYLNWYTGISKKSFKGVRVSSSSSETALSSNVSSFWNTLEDYTFSAELTVWSDGSNKYVPGKYIDIIVRGAEGIKHYASGIYYIIKVEDSISVDGYTQTLKLLKNAGDKSNYVSNNTGEDKFIDNPILHDKNGNIISSASTKKDTSTDYLYGDAIREGGDSIGTSRSFGRRRPEEVDLDNV